MRAAIGKSALYRPVAHLGVWLAAGVLGAIFAAGCANSGGGGGDPCRGACSTFELCCDNGAGSRCVPFGTDPSNCGGCGNVCSSGMCSGGVCVGMPRPDAGPGVDSGRPPTGCTPECGVAAPDCCGGSCVNTAGVPSGTDGRSDPSFQNCGFCGNRCDAETATSCSAPGGAGTPRCLCGNFDACTAGSVCANSGGAFVCTNLQTDPNNCGSLGNRCPMDYQCLSGMCTCGSTPGASCGAGQTCCGGTSCADLSSDNANCGACGAACDGGATCSAGSCSLVCPDGTMCPTPDPAAGVLGGSCCGGTCRLHDNNNCGACDVVCDPDMECLVGSDFLTMTPTICCSTPPPIPGFPTICLSGFP